MLVRWVGKFGFILPQKSGIKWHQQTKGVCCNQVYIEGIFIPLDEPREWNDKKKKWMNYLEELTSANYIYNTKKVDEIWNKINNELDFIYKDIQSQKGQLYNQEGLKWIIIKKIKYPKLKSRKNIDRIMHKIDCERLNEEYKDLIGKKIVLIYPNCD